MILVISTPGDVHARSVVADIASFGVEAAIVDPSEFGNGATLSHRIGHPAGGAITTRSGLRVCLGDVTAVWNRREHPAQPAGVMRDPGDRRFARREWADAFSGLLTALDTEAVNPVWAQRAAVKPLQLEAARRVGIRTPDTLITAEPKQASRFIDEHDGNVIHKVLTAAEEGLKDTRKWDGVNSATLEALTLAPTIFQEYIPAFYDIRATIIGSDILAMKYEVAPAAADSRLDIDAPSEAITLPDGVADKLSQIMRALGLVFGAVDLRVTPDGDFVFFEVNPQGQFLFVEILTGLPISATLARYLARHEKTNWKHRPGSRPGNPLSEQMDPPAAISPLSSTRS